MGIDTIDDQLGPSDGRFFGNGYSRVRHYVKHQQTDSRGADYLASAIYPADWSLKEERSEKPHLASIDAIAIAVSICEDYLSRVAELPASDIARCWIRSCTLTPGRSPVIDLSRIPTRLEVSRLNGRDPHWQIICSLGSFKVRLQITDHAPERKPLSLTRQVSYYGGQFRGVSREVGNVKRHGSLFSAGVRISHNDLKPYPCFGIEGVYPRSTSIIDAAVSCAQVGQVGLYSLDEVHRDDSNPLWLRKAHFSRQGPPAQLSHPSSCDLSLVRTLLIERSGSRWRTADFKGSFEGIDVFFQLVHKLPGPTSGGDYE